MISEVRNIDCMEFMRTLPDKFFDLVIADPPYWSPEEQTGKIRTAGNVQSSLNLGDKPQDVFFKELSRVSTSQIVFGANNYGYPFKGFIVWNKTNIPDDFTMSKCEIASVSENLSKVSKMVSIPSSAKDRFHPTQKPVELYAWILNTYANGGGKIFDPMAGSMSSRIAAYKLGFDYWGCEIDEHYFLKGCERFDKECKGITRLLDGTTIRQLSLFDNGD